MKRWLFFSTLVLLAFAIHPQENLRERITRISLAEKQSVVEFLAHDLLEGRAPGTRGGHLSEIYLRSIFKFMELQPESGKPFLQPFPLIGLTVENMTITSGINQLQYLEDFVGTCTQDGDFELTGDIVFIGFGIQTPLWQWDDFKNFPLRDKIVLVRVNDPGMYSENIFEGKTLTYFGRWKYKIEEAVRRQAKGILLIHTDASAGYDWTVVKNSWGGEELNLESDINNSLKFRGWIKESSLSKLLQPKKINLQQLYKKSLGKRFSPIPLPVTLKITGKTRLRKVLSHNVVAEIPGKSSERIVLSAHIDHFAPSRHLEGDNVFNGAIDNGSAVATMLMATKILKEFQPQLYYTITILACNAEEAGLLGSKYYVEHTDRSTIITNINFESTPVWEETRDFLGIGARFSTLEDMLKKITREEGLKYSYFSMANQGFFYRSDQYSFARYGIPSLWISAGEDDVSGMNKYTNFWKTDYHTVRDEYDPEWKLAGMQQTIKISLLLIDHLNQTRVKPAWKGRLTFPFENKQNN